MVDPDAPVRVSDIRSEVDAALSKMLVKLENLEIYPQVSYAVKSKGKRLRPVITILSARCVGSKRDVIPLALAFELVHTATLVHDDIIDHDDVRRGRPALHVEWSVSDAILAGDLLIALSVELASSFGKRIMVRMARTAMKLCDGEHADTFLQGTIPGDAYLRVVRKKSASLFAAAAECGAIAGGASREETKALADYGENFGIAYQMKDDLADLDGSPIPLSYAREHLDEYCRLAKESLACLRDTGEKRCLLEMADSLRPVSGE
jgi:geranylgeranyl diphosphate synthase type I